MTTTDEARVTDEEIARQVAWARERMGKYPEPPHAAVIIALADRLAARERDLSETKRRLGVTAELLQTEEDARRNAEGECESLRAERAEVVALLERIDRSVPRTDPIWRLFTDAKELLAKLRGGAP